MTTPHAPVLTGQGALIGTFQYMSPEQIEGQDADIRSDIWSLGCVLYEMLSAKRAFDGRTQAGVIGAILEREPDFDNLDVPQSLKAIVRACLSKDPNERIQNAHDVALQLRWIRDHPVAPAIAEQSVQRPSRTRTLVLSAIAISLFLAGAAVAWSLARREPPRSVPLRATVDLGSEAGYNVGGSANLAISPDGSDIVYSGVRNDQRFLFRRRSGEDTVIALPGTDGGHSPFFSPDGEGIGFISGGKLKKTAVDGGSVQAVCDARLGRDAAWGPDGTIVFPSGPDGGLLRVSADGGAPEPFTNRRSGEIAHGWPSFIPDSRVVLFAVSTGQGWDNAQIAAQSLDEGEHRIVFSGGTMPRVTDTGHLVFGRGNAILGVPFDVSNLKVTGEAVTVGPNVLGYTPDGRIHYAVSRAGTLVCIPAAASESVTLSLVDRSGMAKQLPFPPRAYESPRFSPDGALAAVAIRENDVDIWLLDLVRGTLARVTATPGEDESPIWSPDGSRLAYASSRPSQPRITFVKRRDGGGAEETLFTTDRHHHLSSWTPDGKAIVASESGGTSFDIWMTTLADKRLAPWCSRPSPKPARACRRTDGSSRTSRTKREGRKCT